MRFFLLPFAIPSNAVRLVGLTVGSCCGPDKRVSVGLRPHTHKLMGKRLWNQCMRFNCSRLYYPVRHTLNFRTV